MTWPDVIAAAAITAFALLITLHQHEHRSITNTQHTRRTENDHGHQDPTDHHTRQHGPRQADRSEDAREEDHHTQGGS